MYTNHIIYLPKHVYACAHNIIMCHRRRKHLGTAEDDREVKVGPIILCTGCAGKTGEYETILKEKNKRKMYLQNCAIEDINCVILYVVMRVQRFKVLCPKNVMSVRWESCADVLHGSTLEISATSF